MKRYSLFAYGTLKDRGQLSYVIGRKYTGDFEEATLKDHIRVQPHYYMVFESPGNQVDGLLIRDLDEKEVQMLDRYEGVPNYYRKKVVTVEVGGKKEEALLYYNGPDFQLEDYIGE